MTAVDLTLFNPNIPIVDPETGLPTREEIRWRNSLFNRVGGPSDIIQGVIDDATASGLFQAVAGSTSAGAQATIVLQVRAGTGEAFRDASIKLSALAGVASRIEITATTVTIDGTLLSNGGILTGHIGTGQVGTTNIASSAVTTTTIASAAATLAGISVDASSTAAAAATAWTLLAARTVTFTGNPVQIDASCDVRANNSNHLYGFAITIDSTNPEDGNALYNSNFGAGPVFDIAASGTWRSWSRQLDNTPSAASHTLRMYGMSDSTAIDFINKAIRTAEIKR